MVDTENRVIEGKKLLLEIYIGKYEFDGVFRQTNLVDLIEGLNEIDNRKKNPWTWQYLGGILKGYPGFNASLDLLKALQIYAGELDGQSYWQARMRDETIRVFNGTKAHHAWLDPNTKILNCARPECDIKFIKTNPAMKYCPIHRKK